MSKKLLAKRQQNPNLTIGMGAALVGSLALGVAVGRSIYKPADGLRGRYGKYSWDVIPLAENDASGTFVGYRYSWSVMSDDGTTGFEVNGTVPTPGQALIKIGEAFGTLGVK